MVLVLGTSGCVAVVVVLGPGVCVAAVWWWNAVCVAILWSSDNMFCGGGAGGGVQFTISSHSCDTTRPDTALPTTLPCHSSGHSKWVNVNPAED